MSAPFLLPKREPTLLDPIGAIIYYICVTEAIKSGTWTVPSSQKISEMLKVSGKGPMNAQINFLWNDLQWMVDEGLLFAEHGADDLQFRPLIPHSLAQHNVNNRIRKFYPAFGQSAEHQEGQHYHRQRHLDPREFVEKKKTAIRLMALKDFYYANQGQVPQKLLLEFLTRQGLADEDEYYGRGGFIQVMQRIGYVDFPGLPKGEEFSESQRDTSLLIEPGKVFRYQDMYLELRALDYLSEQRSNVDSRRSHRKQLRRSAQKFIVEKRR